MMVCLRRGVPSTPFWEAVVGLGLPTHRIEDRFPGDPRLLRQFQEILAKVQPDIVQTHGYRPNALARLSRPKSKARWLGFWHGATWENWKVRLYNRVDLWALAKADRVVTVSQKQAAILGAKLPAGTKIEVVPNAVVLSPHQFSPEQRSKLRQPYVRDRQTKLLGVFGRFSSEKGQDLFLDAMAQLRDQNLSALLLGEGPDEGRLRQRVRDLSLEDRIHFLGYQEEVARYYALIDVLVLPSRSEGLPNVILEAMTCQVPVVATAVGGVPEIVQDESNGLLARPEDVASLALKIQRMVSDPQLASRLARAGAAFVADAYSLPARLESFRHLYDRVLSPNRP
jgi:glycosyltransferase involved in cell wall biosynthesis